MKRKPPSKIAAKPEPIVDSRILAAAKRAVQPDRMERAKLCTVCGGPCAPASAENLCWVCRRLKISAWSDSDQQAAQE